MENSYEQLIDDYNNGILVQAGESLTDYISRMGGVNYPDKKANGGIITALRIGLANGSEGGRVNFESGANYDYQQFEEFMKKRGQAKKEFELQQLLEELNEYKKSSQGPEVIEAAEGGRIGLANGSLSPDELAALKEEVKQNPTMVNEITDIEFGVNKPGPTTDQGPYPVDNEKRDLIISMLEMGTGIDIIKDKTNATDEEMGEAISVFKYGGAGVPLPSFDSSGKMTDDGLYKGQLKSFEKPSGEENVPSQKIIDMQIKAIEKMIDEGEDDVEKIIFITGARPGLVDLITKRKAQSKANGGVAGILGL